MAECAHLVAMAKRAEAAEARAAKAEDQERYLTERIHGTAQGGGLVREVEVLKRCLFAQQEAAFLEVAKAKAAEARVAELEARVVDLEHALPLAVFQKRVAELEAALRVCERYLDECGPLLASDDPESGVHDVLAQIRAALEKDSEPAPTPRSALCHHQGRPHCAGCPDDATCEASGREPRGTT